MRLNVEDVKKKLNIREEIKFNILSIIIILSLQRFNPLLSIKNESRVEFDEILDLKNYSDELINYLNMKYKLIGTIHHNGTFQYGHY